jgi:hypothetical protein
MLFKNMMMKLSERLLERVQPLTYAATLLLLKFHCPALTFANAVLAAGVPY